MISHTWGTFLFVVLCGCTNTVGDAPREAWLRTTLIEDNQHVLAREPELVAGKFLKMSASPYAYFRGTLGQFQRDMNATQRARVLLVGDPHLENLGTYKTPDGAILFDFNDFDASHYGAWTHDLKRLALSAYIAGHTLQKNDPKLSPETLTALVVHNYITTLQSFQTTAPKTLQVRENAGFGTVVNDLLKRARRDGDKMAKLKEYTVLTGKERTLAKGEHEARKQPDVIRDEVKKLDKQQLKWVKNGLLLYPQSLEKPLENPSHLFAFKAAGRRYGAGVSSYPLHRFYVLVEGPTPSAEDDWLLEFKETTRSAKEMVHQQRTLQETRRNDALLGYVQTSAGSMRVRHHTGYQKGIKLSRIHKKLAKDTWNASDVQAIVALSGRLLAHRHAQGKTEQGTPALSAILDDFIQAKHTLSEDSIKNAVVTYGQKVLKDYARFNTMIAKQGPLFNTQDHQRRAP